jgi:glycine cleavage system H protein
VNADPYNDGWFFRLQPDDTSELEKLLSAEDYANHCADE